jgi:Rps23 Pro-64 3,4-dihydroxylase Tpa1-like proline 4-hydroxylase
MESRIEPWHKSALNSISSRAEELHSVFSTNTPFPHVVIDGFLPNKLISALVSEFPDPDDQSWDRSVVEGIQVKLRSNWQSEDDISPNTADVVHFFNSGSFMKCLSAITGVKRLISDPYFTGGGRNCILPGGVLDIHADGNWHDEMGVHRRLNAILYLNENWDENWGGHFELWDKELMGCVKSISPLANRMLIFETHDFTYHGHPNPLGCPDGNSRKSLIFYYYTAEPRPPEQILNAEPHRALWRKKSLKSL